MTIANNDKLLSDVASYYAEKLTQHGLTPKGVVWNTEDGQLLRFKQLCKIISLDSVFSINDLGCGYGALFDYLVRHYTQFHYIGVDVCETMIEQAQKRLSQYSQVQFVCAHHPNNLADYSIASGIFNVKLGHSDKEWQTYFYDNLHLLNQVSLKGFSFNCLTSYSDQDKMSAKLFYPNPGVIFDYCKQNFSRNVALLHDYDLYEFTILVRK